MINHNKLIMIDDLRSIGELLCQMRHASDALHKLYKFPNLDEDMNQTNWLEFKIHKLNQRRRTKMAMFFNKFAIGKVLTPETIASIEAGSVDEKGFSLVYCMSKHAIAEWAYDEEKLISTFIGDDEYQEVKKVWADSFSDMLDIIARWLGVTEIINCSDCLADKLEIVKN